MVKEVSQMTAGEINKALDKLDVLNSQVLDELIQAGRGYEKMNDTLKMEDPIALKARDIFNKRFELRWEVERRYGPHAPSRLPKGFGPIK